MGNIFSKKKSKNLRFIGSLHVDDDYDYNISLENDKKSDSIECEKGSNYEYFEEGEEREEDISFDNP